MTDPLSSVWDEASDLRRQLKEANARVGKLELQLRVARCWAKAWKGCALVRRFSEVRAKERADG